MEVDKELTGSQLHLTLPMYFLLQMIVFNVNNNCSGAGEGRGKSCTALACAPNRAVSNLTSSGGVHVIHQHAHAERRLSQWSDTPTRSAGRGCWLSYSAETVSVEVAHAAFCPRFSERWLIMFQMWPFHPGSTKLKASHSHPSNVFFMGVRVVRCE